MLSMSKSQHGIRKIEVTDVPVNSVGVVSSSDVISAISPEQTVLVTLMIFKNESGYFQTAAKVPPQFQKEINTHLNPAVALISIEPFPIVTSHHTILFQLNDPHHLTNHIPDSLDGFSYFTIGLFNRR